MIFLKKPLQFLLTTLEKCDFYKIKDTVFLILFKPTANIEDYECIE